MEKVGILLNLIAKRNIRILNKCIVEFKEALNKDAAKKLVFFRSKASCAGIKF